MQDVSSKKGYRLKRVAAGPVSFVAGGQQLTRTDRGRTFHASTYRTMMRVGWAPEVL